MCQIVMTQKTMCRSNEHFKMARKKAGECPSVVKDYNTRMGGVDKLDQKTNIYPADRR